MLTRLPICIMRTLAPVVAALLFGACGLSAAEEMFDLVLRNGRVIDPESSLDAVREIGIKDGVIREVSTRTLTGRSVVDVKGRVVAPGFIDLHQHAVNPEDVGLKAQDGVTTVAELEVGTSDVDAWYEARAGKMAVNYAVSVGHMPCRMAVMGDAPAFLPPANSGAALRVASDEQIVALCRLIERGLERGAVAVGFGLQYTPVAAQWEVLEVFRVAANHRASCHLHVRAKGASGPLNFISAIEELIAATAVTGAPAHVCHVQSSGNELTPRAMQMVAAARSRGLDVSVECYPYTAGMTDIRSAIFDPGWRRDGRYEFKDLQWPSTGERLTEESFARYRATGGLVIFHSNTEEVIRDVVAHPLTMIASDGLRGHPRHAGTSARVLGHYVREQKVLTLMKAIEKLALMPARRLEQRVPTMKNKGRIRVGADADIVVFDPEQIRDRATYEKPDAASVGIEHVLVAGTFVVRGGVLATGVTPGKAVRAPLSRP
jgi:N-acyl-D-aspartate/D-glutamate deacylase